MRTTILHQLQSLLENDDPIAVRPQVQQLKISYEEAAKREAANTPAPQAKDSNEAENTPEKATGNTGVEGTVANEATDAKPHTSPERASTEATEATEATAQTEEEKEVHKTDKAPAAEIEDHVEKIPAPPVSSDAEQTISETKAANPESAEKDTTEKDTAKKTSEPAVRADAEKDETDLLFEETLNQYRKKLKTAREQKQRQEKENLAIRQDLVQSLKDLVEKEENIGKAFATFHAIQEKWKSTGQVSNQDYHSLNTEYNKYVERFFYNINIYKELKDYDLKHNLELKKQLVADQQKVAELNDIKEIEQQVRLNQDKWNEVGPTYKEEWDKIKEEFWAATREAYRKVQNFYDSRRNEQKQNLEAKKALLDQVKQLLSLNLKAHKKWQEKTAQVIDLQNQWRTIGRVPKSEGNALWKEFRAACDEFFKRKRDHYKEIREEQDRNKEQKMALLNKANELKTSTDWGETTKALIDLQQQWKKIGPAHQRDENRLWREFRGACDAYFEAKKGHFKNEDAAQEENLKLKEALIEKITAFEPSENKKSNMDALHAMIEEWRNIGFVPFKEKNRINQEYNKAINGKINALKISDAEKQKLIFTEKIESLREAPNSQRLLTRERDAIYHKIARLQSEINQYENNLGFFLKSKDADKLKQEVEKKIEKVRAQIVLLEDQMKVLTEG